MESDDNYTHTDGLLTTYELIKSLEMIAKTSRNMDLLTSYMLSDIEYKKSRSELYGKISKNLTGWIIVGSVTKLGAIAIAFVAPFMISKIKTFILGL